MALKFVTTGAWGAGTGTPLLASDVDNNFYELQQAIADAVENVPQPSEISNFQIIGSQLMIYLSDGTSFGPYTLPIATFQFRGEWVAPTTYYELDIFSVPGKGLYLVRIQHDTVGGETFDPAATDGDGNDLYLLLFGVNPVIYDVGLFYPNLIGNGLDADGYIAAHIFARTVTFASGMPGSQARLRIAPAADLVLPIAKFPSGGTDPDAAWGTLTFTAGQKVGVFDTPSATALGFATGDMLIVQVPAEVDVAAKDLAVTLVGTVGTGS
jgi:hypothetical protein